MKKFWKGARDSVLEWLNFTEALSNPLLGTSCLCSCNESPSSRYSSEKEKVLVLWWFVGILMINGLSDCWDVKLPRHVSLSATCSILIEKEREWVALRALLWKDVNLKVLSSLSLSNKHTHIKVYPYEAHRPAHPEKFPSFLHSLHDTYNPTFFSYFINSFIFVSC